MHRRHAVYCLSLTFSVAVCSLAQMGRILEVDIPDTQRAVSISSFDGSGSLAPAPTERHLTLPVSAVDGIDAPSRETFAYQQGCQVEELPVPAASPTRAPRVEMQCHPARMLGLEISIANPQDLPPEQLVAYVSYSGCRVRVADDQEIRECIRFHLGAFDMSEAGEVRATIPDFANDAVLMRTVQLGLIDVIVREYWGRHAIGRLVAGDDGGLRRFTDFTKHELNVNRISMRGNTPPKGSFPVGSEYTNAVRLTFSSEGF